MNRCRWWRRGIALMTVPVPAVATGAEMAGLQGTVAALVVLGVLAVQMLCLLLESLLPRRWPRVLRWLAASATAPLALALLWAAWSLSLGA